MNILIISQCSKKALVKTRRILDQFAIRCGTRTWQTAITLEGLKTLHQLLASSARKNTAVACHWIRGKNNTELMWIVGNASCFSANGSVPTNITKRDVLRMKDENQWHTFTKFNLAARIAALFHDFGKANQAFQDKLKSNKKDSDEAYYHEWISLRLFQAFVGKDNDETWLNRLAHIKPEESETILKQLIRDGDEKDKEKSEQKPFSELPPLALVVGWLVVTHHHPLCNNDPVKDRISLDIVESSWNRWPKKGDINKTWQFTYGIPTESKTWCAAANQLAASALKQNLHQEAETLKNAHAMHLARLALMLGDHTYSSEPAQKQRGDETYQVYANTDQETKKLKQQLDEHLIGVAERTKEFLTLLPSFITRESLPKIGRHSGFTKRTTHERFAWQNKSYELARNIQQKTQQQGFFGINMASTGCGKTIANGRILYGLSNESGARFSIAMGLRTLTLQTGDAYRDRMQLNKEDLAVLVGCGEIKELRDYHQESNQDSTTNHTGSESASDFMDDTTLHVHYEGKLSKNHALVKWLKHSRDKKAHALVMAPILVCTIDYLIRATEQLSGGKYIPAVLRLLSSDLVLDELDDFGIDDLPALSRLVYWSGILGSRVLISTATLPPSMAQGMYEAYKQGRAIWQKNYGTPFTPVHIPCAWFDEFSVVQHNCEDESIFRKHHNDYISKRIEKLSKAPIRQRARIEEIGDTIKEHDVPKHMATLIHPMIQKLHDVNHTVDPHSNKRVSFGLIRFANINPLLDVACEFIKMFPHETTAIRLCCYHSQHLLLVRSEIEKNLDTLLNRKDQNLVFEKEELRKHIDALPDTIQDVIFVVMATSVAEVGRDHDYDWAIVEPSSMRSIVQLAGRVRRHRPEAWEHENILLLGTNLKTLKNPSKNDVTYCRPGFETQDMKLTSHQLKNILQPEQYEKISAMPRIQEPHVNNPCDNLAALEHEAIKQMLLNNEEAVRKFWLNEGWLTSVLQKKYPFRKTDKIPTRYYRLPTKRHGLEWRTQNTEGKPETTANKKFKKIERLEFSKNIEPFAAFDYEDEEILTQRAQEMRYDDIQCFTEEFGWVDLDSSKAWLYYGTYGIGQTP